MTAHDPSNPATTTPKLDLSGEHITMTGATGFVGRAVLERSLESGADVTILVRSAEKAAHVVQAAAQKTDSDASRVRIIEGALHDPDCIARALEHASACIHLVGIIRETKGGQTFDRIHVDATRAVVQACATHDPALRYIHMSALGVGPDTRAGYRDSKHRAEQIVRSSSLRWTIFEPGLIFGLGGEFTEMATSWVRGASPPFVFLPYFSRWKQTGFGFETPMTAPVHVRDVALAFTKSIVTPQSERRTYPMSGPTPTGFDEMLRIYQKHTPRAKQWLRPIGLPWRFAALQARAASALGLGTLLPFDEGMAIMGGRDSVADNSELERDLGLELEDFEAVLARIGPEL